MREKVYYVNHNSEKLNMATGGIIADANDLRDYSWSYSTSNDMISGFSKGVSEKNFPVLIVAPTKKQFLNLRNNAFKIFERDIAASKKAGTPKYGKLYIGEYYLKCFIIGSKTEDYYSSNVAMNVEWTIVTDDPTWYKDTDYIFEISSGDDTGLDYPYDYSYDYADSTSSAEIINNGVEDAPFRMIINGPCQNPKITVDEHDYQVNTTVNSGEYMVIDASEKTIYKYSNTGVPTNVMRYRNREDYVFQNIEEGAHAVTWSGDFKFSLVLMERRSEPEWI